MDFLRILEGLRVPGLDEAMLTNTHPGRKEK